MKTFNYILYSVYKLKFTGGAKFICGARSPLKSNTKSEFRLEGLNTVVREKNLIRFDYSLPYS